MKPLDKDPQRAVGWRGRVAFGPPNRPVAFRPGQVLVGDADNTDTLVSALVPGYDRWKVSEEHLELPGFVLLEHEERKSLPSRADRVVADVQRETLRLVDHLRAQGYHSQPNHVFLPHDITGNPYIGNPYIGNPYIGNPYIGNPYIGNPYIGNPYIGNPYIGNPYIGNPGAALQWPTQDVEMLTGIRPSSAQPRPTADSGGESTLKPRVLVLDTGLPHDRKTKMPGLANHSVTPAEGTAETPPFLITGRDDKPIDLTDLLKDDLGEREAWDVFDTEADSDHRLDPAAGHGGFIADIIARIEPEASITVVRVLGQLGAGDELKVAQILHKVIGHFDLVNLSFGTYTPEMPWAMAQAVRTVQRGRANGDVHPAVIVASAGNDGTWLAPVPAALPDVVSVAALDWHEQGPAPFSNYGPWVSACAPGTDIEAAFWDSTEGERLWPGAASWSGTSFAAPYVVGALARTMRILDSDPVRAVERLLHAPGLLRLPMHGTVVRGFLPQAPPPNPQA